jgi:hypothetical protein
MASHDHRKFLFLIASARCGGNTEQLVRRAAARLPAHHTQQWINLLEFNLPPFFDLRHASEAIWAPMVEGPARILLEATLGATDLVMVAPVYWYSLPTAAKLYLDHWSAWLRAPGWHFKLRMAGKTLWGVSIISDEDPRFADPLKDSLRLTAEYMQMSWGGFLLGHGNRPGDVLDDAKSVAAADTFLAALK